MNRLNPQTKLLIIVGVLVVGILGLSITSFLRHKDKVGVKVVVLPADSVLAVDNVPTKAGTIYLTKGKHTLVATRQYFTAITKTMDFTNYDTSKTLYLLPLPESDQARQYLSEHPEVQAQREAASGDQSAQEQQVLSKNKLIPFLPYTGPASSYIVDYGSTTQKDGTSKLTIFIESDTEQAKQDALNWIKNKGVNPSTLTIVYQSLTNPTSPQAGSGGSEYQ
jgi:hypothetical protein